MSSAYYVMSSAYYVIPSAYYVIPSVVEESPEISPCASLSRDDGREGALSRDDNNAQIIKLKA